VGLAHPEHPGGPDRRGGLRLREPDPGAHHPQGPDGAGEVRQQLGRGDRGPWSGSTPTSTASATTASSRRGWATSTPGWWPAPTGTWGRGSTS
jgi:hypothetical protein